MKYGLIIQDLTADGVQDILINPRSAQQPAVVAGPGVGGGNEGEFDKTVCLGMKERRRHQSENG